MPSSVQMESAGVQNPIPVSAVRLGRPRFLRKWLLWVVLGLAATGLSLLLWGNVLLISSDPLPARVDEAVVLQGSILGEQARLVGAVQLLKQRPGAKMLVSVPKESYWGQPVSPIAYAYIEKSYGHEMAGRTEFCETGSDVSSTEQEAMVLIGCIREHGSSSIVVVTSSYHTRRAGIIWRKILRQRGLPLKLCVYRVDDPEFRPSGWWRDRRSAKTWLMEMTKLFWTVVFG